MTMADPEAPRKSSLAPSKAPQVAQHKKKVAIVMKNETTQFLELDQFRPLAAIIKDVCTLWNLGECGSYALRFDENSRTSFITERNRNDIKNGTVLRLTHSPAKTAADIAEKVKKGDDLHDTLKELSFLAADYSFASEYFSKQGLQILMNLVSQGSVGPEPLAYTLKAFVLLMEHGTVSCDVISNGFISVVYDTVRTSTKQAVVDAVATQAALEILESVLLHGSEVPKVNINVTDFISHLQSCNTEIQKSAIALVNAMFLRADTEKRKQIARSLQTKAVRHMILDKVIRNDSSRGEGLGTEMAHQLYTLQTNVMNALLAERMRTKVDPDGQEAIRDVTKLRVVAFGGGSDSISSDNRKKTSYANEYKKLGFKSPTKPTEDFTDTPPGILALDVMAYFAERHGEEFAKVVLENSSRSDEHDCAFVQTSIALTKLLCDILCIGEPPHEEGQDFHPMLFAHEQPFEEFYCVCIQLLNKTWKEMRATSADFQKVISVVREQITKGLKLRPSKFEDFKTSLFNKFTYTEITNIWQQERQAKEEWESQATPIVELRAQIKPEILDLIKEQRLHYLVEGTLFNKYHSKGRVKDKYWYCKLSPNHKVFHYGDCAENAKPSLEQLSDQFPVVDIKYLALGKDCPLIQTNKKLEKLEYLAFSLIPEPGEKEPLNFIARDEYNYALWTDGLNALLGNEMASAETRQDLELLLAMETKIRLLDIEGVTIPDKPPPIPDDPPDFNFTYTY